jgi:spore germination protein YaaH
MKLLFFILTAFIVGFFIFGFAHENEMMIEPEGASLPSLASRSVPSPSASASFDVSAPAKPQPSPTASPQTPLPSPKPLIIKNPPKIYTSIPYWDQERALASFKQHVELIDYVSFFWYYLKPDGSIARYSSNAVEDWAAVEFARSKRVKTFALVANLPEEKGVDWEWRRVDRIISDPARRRQHVEDLVKLAERFDGINIDYEELQESQTKNMGKLVQELGAALHEKGKILRVPVYARESKKITFGHDWKAIAESGDQLGIMTYNEHYDGGEPGPIASIPWVRKSIEFAIEIGVPRDKIFMGVPLYGIDWPKDGGKGRGVEYDEVAKIITDYDAAPHYDQTSESPHLDYAENGNERIIWFENGKSIEAKVKLARELGIGGVALWRLGREDPAVWNALSLLKQSQ